MRSRLSLEKRERVCRVFSVSLSAGWRTKDPPVFPNLIFEQRSISASVHPTFSLVPFPHLLREPCPSADFYTCTVRTRRRTRVHIRCENGSPLIIL